MHAFTASETSPLNKRLPSEYLSDRSPRLAGQSSNKERATFQGALQNLANPGLISGSKESVLRKLLETQENYIYELEAKCKVMSAQLLDTP